MSVNLYLKEEEVKKIDGFVIRTRRDKGQEWNEYEIPGIKLYHEKGRWYTTISEGTDPIPSIIADIIEGVSLQEFIPIRPKREYGIYHHESAEAELEPYGEKSCWIKIKGDKLPDVAKLLRMVKIGSIRPDESYEGEQGGLSRAKLLARIKTVEEWFKNLSEIHDKKKSELLNLIKILLKNKWPFCRKSRIIAEINKILGL